MGPSGHDDARPDNDLVASTEPTARPLSATAVENALVEKVYSRLSAIYDIVFGPVFESGRRRAIERMAIRPGDRILEVGVGTGLTSTLYPADCEVTGVDLSEPMLEKARARIAKGGLRHVQLMQMDAADLRFPDGAFDIVWAPYLISVVPDPVRVASEMHRVCRRGGLLVFLNHFRSRNPLLSRVERLISPLTRYVGFKSDVDLSGFLAQTGLEPVSIEKVNQPRIWSLVTCVKT